MTKILAIDTAQSSCSAALSIDGHVTASHEPQPRQHIQKILPMIDKLLKQSDLSVTDIDAIGFNHGPGSFTGLRIGMGVVQGLAFGANLQVMPVSTLQSMAQAAIDEVLLDSNQIAMPMIDARMNEVYWGVYKNIDGLARPICVDMLNIPEDVDIAGLTEDGSGQFGFDNIAIGVGDGWQFRDRVSVRPLQIKEQVTGCAEQVLSLAKDIFQRGKSVPIEEIEPLYLRNKISWTKRQRLRSPGS